MEKLNIAEILKDCPTGMELDSTLFEGLEFDCIVDNEYLPIRCRIKHPNGGYTVYNFTKYGCWLDTTFAKCVIFPKGKTTWEGFQRSFKDGDVVAATITPEGIWIGIFKQCGETSFESHCCLSIVGEFYSKGFKNHSFRGLRLATEEEKQKLFDAIKDNGYKWNHETKTLEKLIEPKFKVEDVIQDIDTYKVKITEVNIEDECYEYESMIAKGIGSISFSEQDNWKLVTNKFDISTFKPFDKVLVRCGNNAWHIQFFEKYDKRLNYPFVCMCYNKYRQCIPYEGNEHLLGTTNDCDEYYKTWK